MVHGMHLGWLDSPPASDDFMTDREQPVMQERELLDN